MVCSCQSLDCSSAVCHGKQHVDQCHVLKLESFFTFFAWFVAACIKQFPPPLFSQLCGQELLYSLCILWQCLILVTMFGHTYFPDILRQFSLMGISWVLKYPFFLYLLCRYMSWVITEVLRYKLCSVTSLIMGLSDCCQDFCSAILQ